MTIAAAFAHFPTLTTSRLILRQIWPTDAAALFAMLADEATMRYYGHEPHRSLAETQDLIERYQLNYALNEAIHWGIARTGETTIIGSCSLHHIEVDSCRAETGYVLNRAQWRRGIMREAMAAILTFGFAEMGLHRVEAIIDIANEPSQGLLRNLGFSYEGNLRQRYRFQDHFEDEHYFGLLKDEWHGGD